MAEDRGKIGMSVGSQTGIEIPAKGCGHETRLRGLGSIARHCPLRQVSCPILNQPAEAVIVPFRGIRGPQVHEAWLMAVADVFTLWQPA